MAESLFALGYFTLLVGVCYGVGRFVARFAGFWERFVVAVPVGMGVLSLILLALGVCHLFIPATFYTILALGVPGWVLLLRDVGTFPLSPQTPLPPNPSPFGGRGVWGERASHLLDLCFAALFAGLGLCTLIAALAPPGGGEWDALSYHLTVPKTYLAAGRVFYIPYDHHSNFPFLLQMLYTLMLGVGSVAGAKLCHFGCGILLVLSVYTFAVRHNTSGNGHRTGQVAALLVAASPIVLWEAGIAYADLATALYTWLSLALLVPQTPPTMPISAPTMSMLEPTTPMLAPTTPMLVLTIPMSETTIPPSALTTPSSTSTVPPLASTMPPLATTMSPLALTMPPSALLLGKTLLSALLMGFAIGTKWTVLGFWGIVLAGLAVSGVASERRVSATLVKRVALWGAVSLAVASPWLLRSFLYTGSPVYPYFYAIFGGRYWSAENAAQYSADQATLGLGKSPLFALLAPWLMNVLPTARKFNEYPFGFAACLVPLLLAAPFSRTKYSKTTVALVLYALLGYVFWFFLVQGTRYLLPLLPVLALLAAEVLMNLWNDAKSYAKYAGSVAVAASAVFALWFAANVFATPAIRVVTGAQSRSEYVAGTQWMGTLLPASEWINANTPKTAKVALFDVVFGYYIDRSILWANPNHAANLLPWDDYGNADTWLADFKRRGYTYLVTDEAFYPKPDSPLSQQAWRTWLPEAVSAGLVAVVFEKANAKGQVCRVYQIR